MLARSELKSRFGVALGISCALHVAAYFLIPPPQYPSLPRAAVSETILDFVTVEAESPPEPKPAEPSAAPEVIPVPQPQPVPAPVPPRQTVQPEKPVKQFRSKPPPRPRPPSTLPIAPKPMLASAILAPSTPAPMATDENTGDGSATITPVQAVSRFLAAQSSGSGNSTNIGFVPPSYCRCPAPAYPAEAKRNRQQGTVLLTLAVDERGLVKTVRVKDSSGVKSLDTAAVRAVKAWQFEPARRDGNPTAHEVEVPVRFALR